MKKTSSSRLFLLIAASIILWLLLGCQASEQKSNTPEAEKPPKNALQQDSGIQATSPADKKPQEHKPQLELKIYFANPQADKLVMEKRQVEETEAVAKVALEELIKGPQESTTAQATIPSGTRLLGVTIKDKVAQVNFSAEFADNHSGGSAAEIMTVYSVVNTLTEFPTIEAVEFFINNEKLATLGGFDLTEPVKRREDLIAR